MELDILQIFSLLTVFVSLMLAAFLLTIRSENYLSNLMLAMFLIVNAIDSDSIFLGSYIYPNFPALGIFLSSLVFFKMPLLYLYLVSVTFFDFKLEWKHLWHGLPFLVNFIVFIPRFYAAGAATIQLQNELNGGNVTVDLTGACTLNGTMFVNDLNIDITGASNLNISGTSASVDLDATGASNLKDYGFETNNFTCDLEGGCNVNLTVQQSLNVKANGASNVYYKGNGTVSSQDLNGGSTIQKMN